LWTASSCPDVAEGDVAAVGTAGRHLCKPVGAGVNEVEGGEQAREPGLVAQREHLAWAAGDLHVAAVVAMDDLALLEPSPDHGW
jgi:hypothetical protein